MPKKKKTKKKKKEPKDTVYGKALSQILFETIKGERLPRIVGDYDKLSKQWKELLEPMPHLYQDTYKGSVIKLINKEDIDEEVLQEWEKYGFKPKEHFHALYEYYTPLVRINIHFPIVEVQEELLPEEKLYAGIDSTESFELFQQIDDMDSEEDF